MKDLIKKSIYLLYKLRMEYTLKKKMCCIYDNVKSKLNNQVNSSNEEEHIRFWSPLSKNINPKWFRTYSLINGNNDPHYVPENIYYTTIELILNYKPFYKAYSDKNFYESHYNSVLFPKTFLRKINNVYYDEFYKPIKPDIQYLNKLTKNNEKLIVKPAIDSGGGINVLLFSLHNGYYRNEMNEILNVDFLNRFSRDLVVQEYIKQHSFFSQFNESSVNTVRIFTYRDVDTEEIHPIQAVLRIGKKGKIVDNQASGGIACGISKKGLVKEFAVDKEGNKYFEYNNIIFANVGYIPKFIEMVETASQIAAKNHYFRLISFDFTVDQNDKILLIEINYLHHEINFFQMNNGPLFDTFTNDIINYCNKHRLNFSFDFVL